MPSPNCGFRVVRDISRNFFEILKTPSRNCALHVGDDISRIFIERHEKFCPPTADSALSMICRAISSRYEKRLSKLWISRRQWYFAHFGEMRGTPSPDFGFRVVDSMRETPYLIRRFGVFSGEIFLTSAFWRFVVQTGDFARVFWETNWQWYFAQFQ